MGVLNRKDVFSSKYPTAQIVDGANRIHFVPIKHIIGDYFLAVLNKQIYAFRFKGDRILTYRESLSKSFQTLIFYTDHYLPITGKSNALHQMLEVNNLPKVNNHLRILLAYLAKQETTALKQHDLDEAIKSLEKENADVFADLISFISSLGTKHIVTPIKTISEFIEDDLIATDPKFMGMLAQTMNIAFEERQKISNASVTGVKPMLKLMLIMGLILVGGAGIYMAYDSGLFDTITNSIPSFSLGEDTPETILFTNQYGSPFEAAQTFLDGDLLWSDIPEEWQPAVRAELEKIQNTKYDDIPIASPLDILPNAFIDAIPSSITNEFNPDNTLEKETSNSTNTNSTSTNQTEITPPPPPLRAFP